MPTHVARGPYRVFSTDGPTVLLDVDGDYRRDNVAHVVLASGATVPGPAQHPVLRRACSFHEAKTDGQRYAVDRIADHSLLPYGILRVQVYWTGYPHPTWMDASDAPQDTLRLYPRRASSLGLPHTSADAPPETSRDQGPIFRAAAGVAAPPPWPSAPDPFGRRGSRVLPGGGGGVFRGFGAPGTLRTADAGRRHRAAAPRRTTRTLGAQAEIPRQYENAEDGLTPPKQTRHLRGQGDVLSRTRGTLRYAWGGPPCAGRPARRQGTVSAESAGSQGRAARHRRARCGRSPSGRR